MRFNINHNVRVKLTEDGRALHRKNHDDLVAHALSLGAKQGWDYRAPKEDADGWSEWQLWILMQEFGPHITHGAKLPFETTIEIVETPTQ